MPELATTTVLVGAAEEFGAAPALPGSTLYLDPRNMALAAAAAAGTPSHQHGSPAVTLWKHPNVAGSFVLGASLTSALWRALEPRVEAGPLATHSKCGQQCRAFSKA